jgi:hypothetical protein
LDDVLTLAPSLTYRKRRAPTNDQKTVKLPTSNLQTAGPRRKKRRRDSRAITESNSSLLGDSLVRQSLPRPLPKKRRDPRAISESNSTLLGDSLARSSRLS